jgi:hypothetical protein
MEDWLVGAEDCDDGHTGVADTWDVGHAGVVERASGCTGSSIDMT